MTGDPYLYPGATNLRNKLGLIDSDGLDAFERRMVAARAAEGIPSGDFDLPHLQAIRRHLFQDVYDGAGELRTVEICKGGHQFMFRQFIKNGMADVHRRLIKANRFKGSSLGDFARAALQTARRFVERVAGLIPPNGDTLAPGVELKPG